MLNQKINLKNIDKSKIPVVIFCGGRGTRLKEETEIIPKPLVKIGEKPILWHIMKIYRNYGFNRFILPVGYKGEKIKEYFYHYPVLQSDFTVKIDNSKERKIIFHNPGVEDWQVTVVDTGLDVMTGARLKRVEKFIDNELFALTYGDGVANINLDKLLALHLSNARLATVAGVRPLAKFGELRIKAKGTADFCEKPQIKSGGYVNGGFFMLNQKILKFLNNDETLSFEGDVLPKIAQKRQLGVFRHNGYWQCMDTLRDFEILNQIWKTGKAPWQTWN
jgi:glucose-1-phosphate cytidylyltransferase